MERCPLGIEGHKGRCLKTPDSKPMYVLPKLWHTFSFHTQNRYVKDIYYGRVKNISVHIHPYSVGTQQLPTLDVANSFVSRLFALKLFATDASFKTHRTSCFTLVLELLEQSYEDSQSAVGYQLAASLPLRLVDLHHWPSSTTSNSPS